VLLTYLFLVFARQREWSWPLSIAGLIAVSIPVGLALGWLKHRLQPWSRIAGWHTRSGLSATAPVADTSSRRISRSMDRLEAYRSWWRPLPAWLKLVTVVGVYPAWLFIAYCVFTGASKSRGALFAFGIFAVGALLHIAFDRRNRRAGGERGGFDFFGGH
jgi:hypothetical protein